MNDPHPAAESSDGNRSAGQAFGLNKVFATALVAVLFGLASVLYWVKSPSTDDLLRMGRRASSQNDHQSAENFARQILEVEANSKPALFLAARSAEQTGRFEEALAYFHQIPDDSTTESVQARLAAGEIYLQQLKRLTPAEEQFRRVLDQEPGNTIAIDRLAFVLSLETRNWESQPYQLDLIRSGDVSPRRLHLLCLNDRVHTDYEMALEYHRADPDDGGARLALAERALANRDYTQAERLLREVITERPQLVEAYVKLGNVLLSTGVDQAFLRWHAGLPEQADAHPGAWVLRGRFASQNSEHKSAARCYWEAIRLDSCSQQAIYGLGQSLISLNLPAKAEPFLQRARQLQLYSNAVYDTHTDRPLIVPKKARTVAKLASAIGLQWENLAWTFLADHGYQTPTAERLAAWTNSIPSDLSTDRTRTEFLLASKIDLSSWPLPNWLDAVERATSRSPSGAKLTSVTFADQAVELGIDFQYHNAADSNVVGLGRVYEFTGGGIAVIDFDRDGWPDLHLTQGSRQPPLQEQSEDLDRLFRNLEGEQFIDTTMAAGIQENRFSQGVSAGDFNNDGFPDLYVANLGVNRLYQNNGDGTFTDLSASTDDNTAFWTTSCVIADINGDSLPDIYAVNYLSGREIYTRVCRDRKGLQNSCLPVNFSAAQDQLLLNTGDGRFTNATSTTGVTVSNGKGLGIVAADFQQSGKLSLFISNDGVPNFLFLNENEGRGQQPQFTEQALPLGLALNRDGRHEACMGIAAGDADGDGLLDLFVTNFTEESNTLYQQLADGLFQDNTQHAGLAESSFQLLGFGTQFLDADLDGDLDLILTNGHVDDYRAAGLMYHMHPQFFQNAGGGRFVEGSLDSSGPYFQQRYLGRGLARLDWNRDGKEDIAVSHLDAPVALLTNLTHETGHFLSVRLCGVTSDRDAIGTTVSLNADGRSLVRQLTAGSGYQASNEKRLVFGLGEATMAEHLKIRWPSGFVQEVGDVPADQELLMIEGRAKPIILQKAK